MKYESYVIEIFLRDFQLTKVLLYEDDLAFWFDSAFKNIQDPFLTNEEYIIHLF